MPQAAVMGPSVPPSHQQRQVMLPEAIALCSDSLLASVFCRIAYVIPLEQGDRPFGLLPRTDSRSAQHEGQGIKGGPITREFIGQFHGPIAVHRDGFEESPHYTFPLSIILRPVVGEMIEAGSLGLSRPDPHELIRRRGVAMPSGIVRLGGWLGEERQTNKGNHRESFHRLRPIQGSNPSGERLGDSAVQSILAIPQEPWFRR